MCSFKPLAILAGLALPLCAQTAMPLLGAGTGGIANGFRQSVACSTSAPSVTCSFPQTTSTGNGVAVFVALTLTSSVCTVTSPPSTTYTAGPTAGGVDQVLRSFYALSMTGAATVTVACTGGMFLYVGAGEFSGFSTLDRTGTNTVAAQNPTVTTSGSVTSSTEYVIAAAQNAHAVGTYTAGSGYTIRQIFALGVGAIEDQNAKTGLSGTQTAAFSTTDPSNLAGAVILTFK